MVPRQGFRAKLRSPSWASRLDSSVAAADTCGDPVSRTVHRRSRVPSRFRTTIPRSTSASSTRTAPRTDHTGTADPVRGATLACVWPDASRIRTARADGSVCVATPWAAAFPQPARATPTASRASTARATRRGPAALRPNSPVKHSKTVAEGTPTAAASAPIQPSAGLKTLRAAARSPSVRRREARSSGSRELIPPTAAAPSVLQSRKTAKAEPGESGALRR